MDPRRRAPASPSTLLVVALVLTFALLAHAVQADEVMARASSATFPLRIDAIRIQGLVRTKPAIVQRELGFREGDVITKDQLDIAVTRLWNTTIFAHVKGEVVLEKGRHVAVFELDDRWTLNPLLGGGVGGSAYYFRVGASDNNVLGRFLEIDAQYEYFEGFSGGQLVLRNPRLFGERLDMLAQVESLARPRPGFSDLRTQGILEVLRLALSDRVRYGIRINAVADSFLSPLDPPALYFSPIETLIAEPSLRIGRVDTVRLRQRGASLEVRPSAAATTSAVASTYAAINIEALAFATFGDRYNLAVRVRGSGITKVPPVLQLYAGGLDLVRGFPDSYVRTTAMTLANVEMRYAAFDSTWIALMPVVFADGIVARSPFDGTTKAAFAVGGGVRILVPKFVGTGIRVDLAVPLYSSIEDGAPTDTAPLKVPPVLRAPIPSLQPSLGVYQFF